MMIKTANTVKSAINASITRKAQKLKVRFESWMHEGFQRGAVLGNGLYLRMLTGEISQERAMVQAALLGLKTSLDLDNFRSALRFYRDAALIVVEV